MNFRTIWTIEDLLETKADPEILDGLFDADLNGKESEEKC